MSYRRVSPQLAYGAAHGTNFVLAAAGVRYSATLLVFPKVEEVTPSSPRAANEAKWKEEILPNSTTLAQILYFPAPPRFVRIDIVAPVGASCRKQQARGKRGAGSIWVIDTMP